MERNRTEDAGVLREVSWYGLSFVAHVIREIARPGSSSTIMSKSREPSTHNRSTSWPLWAIVARPPHAETTPMITTGRTLIHPGFSSDCAT